MQVGAAGATNDSTFFDRRGVSFGTSASNSLSFRRRSGVFVLIGRLLLARLLALTANNRTPE